MIAPFQAEGHSPEERQRLKRYVSGPASTDASSRNIVFKNPSLSGALQGSRFWSI